MLMKKINNILEFLDELYPSVGCELNYTKDYELAIAVMLSAQTTDASVNRVTPALFSKYSTIQSLAEANPDDVMKYINSLGLARNKSRNIVEFAKKLHYEYNDQLPSDKSTLTAFPGIGNKSAGVIRAEVFKIPDLPVDTHILRISNRLQLTKSSNPDIVEKDLKNLIEKERWIKIHHQLIHFGRYFCIARNPNCQNCKIKSYCKENKI